MNTLCIVYEDLITDQVDSTRYLKAGRSRRRMLKGWIEMDHVKLACVLREQITSKKKRGKPKPGAYNIGKAKVTTKSRPDNNEVLKKPFASDVLICYDEPFA